MQIILTMALYNYKVQVIIKKNSLSVLVNHGKTFETFFQDFPGLTNKIQGLLRTFQDSKKIQDFSRMWQPGKSAPTTNDDYFDVLDSTYPCFQLQEEASSCQKFVMI